MGLHLRWSDMGTSQESDLTIRLQARPGSRFYLQSDIIAPACLSRVVRLRMPLPIIITAPNYAFGQSLKKSAPVGINVAVGYQSAYSPNANVPAVAIVGF